MAENKTKPVNLDVIAFIDAITGQTRRREGTRPVHAAATGGRSSASRKLSQMFRLFAYFTSAAASGPLHARMLPKEVAMNIGQPGRLSRTHLAGTAELTPGNKQDRNTTKSIPRLVFDPNLSDIAWEATLNWSAPCFPGFPI